MGVRAVSGFNGKRSGHRMAGAGGSSFVVPSVTYLPTVAASPTYAYFMRRMVSNYAGPLIRVQRQSDNAQMDVAQLANGLPDLASVVSWAAGSEVRMATWYDQSGNARHATQSTYANMPLFDAAGLRGQATAYRAFKAAVFDGWLDVLAGNVRRPKSMIVPVGATYELQNNTMFIAIDPKTALYNEIYYAFRASSGGTSMGAVGTAALIAGIYQSSSPTDTVGNRRARQVYQTAAFASGVGAYNFYQDGSKFLASNSKWQQTGAGMTLGDDIAGSGDFLSEDNFLGFALYPNGSMSDANVTAVRDAINSSFGFSTSFDSLQVSVGDSIEYGPTVNQSLEGRTVTRVARPLISGTPAMYNFGLSSQLLTGGGGMAANAATREFLMPSTDYQIRTLRIEIAGNDIATNGNTPGYANATLIPAYQTYVANARAAGYNRIVTTTILPRSWSTQQAIEVGVFNAWIRANTVGADAIADWAADPIMGNASNLGTAYYQGDNVHPSGTGYEILGPISANAVNSANSKTGVADMWDPVNKSASVTLSENNLRMTAAGTNQAAKSIASKASGKFYFEIELTAGPGSLGVGNAAASNVSWVGSDNNSVGIDTTSGGVFISGSNQGSAGVGSGANGNVFGFAVDRGANKVWVSKTGSFGSGQDPVAGTGGFNLPVGALYIMASGGGGGSYRVRTTSAQFLTQPPTGYTAWVV